MLASALLDTDLKESDELIRNCEYILDAVYALKEFEEDPATHRAIRAAILAMIDEHRRHIGERPLLESSIIDQIEESGMFEDREQSSAKTPCQPVPDWVLEANDNTAKSVVLEVLNRLDSPLLKHL